MSRTSSTRWRDRIGTFALAMVLAVIVWVVAVQQENPTQTTTLDRIPVSARNLPEDMVMVDNSNLTLVDVRVRAPRSVMETLTSSDIDAYVDLSEAQPGRQELPIQALPGKAGVEVLNNTPEFIIVDLEQRASKRVPVHVNVVDSPPFGYVAASPVITPTEVLVKGAASQVETVRRAEVPVRLLNARADVEVTEFVTLRDSNGAIVTGLTAEPRSVEVLVPVEQRQGFAEKPVLPRFVGQPAPNYLVTGVSSEPSAVTLFGDPDVLSEMPPFVETIPINIEGATEDIEERVPVVVPETVSVVAAQAVDVRIGIEPIEGSVTMTLTPVVQGLGSGLTVSSIEPRTIDVIIQGPLPRLQSFKADENVQAILDLSNLDVGVYQLIPILVHPEGATVLTVLPETVQVTIELAPTPLPEAEDEEPPAES